MKANVEYRRTGKELTKGKILNIFLVGLIFSIVLSIITGIGQTFAPTIDRETMIVIDPGMPALNLLFSVLALLVSGYVTYGFTKMMIGVTKNEQPNIENVLTSSVKDQPIKAPLLMFITNVFLALWTLLFIIPGLVKSYSYAMTSFILVNEPNIQPVDAITKSRKLMDGKKMQLFLLDLSYVGWYILSLFTLGILFIWVSPWHQTARTLFFTDAYKQ
jgi:uncharacterized membrane protein